MKTTTFVIALGCAAFFAACTDQTNVADPKKSSGGSHPSSNKGGSAGHAGTSAGAAGVGSTGGVASPGGPSGTSGGTGGEDDGVLTLSAVSAQIVGRNGSTLRFTVSGSEPSVGLSGIAVTIEDASGTPVPLFDSDWDGIADTAQGRLVFDAPLIESGATFSGTATLSRIANASKLVSAQVALVDGRDRSTDPMAIQIGAQALVSLGAACDPKLLKNRCDPGLSCTGVAAPKCAPGVAPTIVELKYLRDSGGPVILTRGTDPDDDMGSVHIELLDALNKLVTVDTDSAPTSILDTRLTNLSDQGSYFSLVQGGLSLESLVPRVRVTPIDIAGHMGAPAMADLSNVVMSGDTQPCDPRGFSGCIAGDVCAPGLPRVASMCAKARLLRPIQCSAAIRLDPATGATFASGRAEGASLWDPPADCTNPGNLDRPEGVLALHLASSVAKLTIDTKRPETNIDTVLYLLPGCPDDSSASLACNDDGPDGGYASEITATNVPAGDYTIIVESTQMPGGAFGVSISTH